MRTTLISAVLITLSIAFASGQTDTISTTPIDTTAQVVADTVPTETSDKKERKKRDRFKVMAGVNLGTLDLADNSSLEGSGGVGLLLGASYQRGRFFYWELGAQYNRLGVTVSDQTNESSFSIGSIDIPISVGINILSATDRILGLRAFVGATPSILLDISDNDVGVNDDDLNSFVAYGHGGIGLDVAFIYLEAVYKYGLGDALDSEDSRPSQFQVILGFRF